MNILAVFWVFLNNCILFLKDIIYLFLERRERREKERERNTDVKSIIDQLLLLRATQACAPTCIKPVSPCFAGQRSANWATPVRASYCFKRGILAKGRHKWMCRSYTLQGVMFDDFAFSVYIFDVFIWLFYLTVELLCLLFLVEQGASTVTS